MGPDCGRRWGGPQSQFSRLSTKQHKCMGNPSVVVSLFRQNPGALFLPQWALLVAERCLPLGNKVQSLPSRSNQYRSNSTLRASSYEGSGEQTAEASRGQTPRLRRPQLDKQAHCRWCTQRKGPPALECVAAFMCVRISRGDAGFRWGQNDSSYVVVDSLPLSRSHVVSEQAQLHQE